MGERQSRPPDYKVQALCKKTELRGNIGVAWNQPDGSIQIKLNAFTVLDTGDHDFVISLFKNDQWPKKNVDAGSIKTPLPKGSHEIDDDEDPPPY